MTIRYVFDECPFGSKKEVQEYINQAKNACEIGEVIDETHDYYTVFNSLVLHHLKSGEKRGCGVSHFVFVVGEHNEKQLNVVRTDGSAVSMSCNYSHITTRTTEGQKQAQAFRRAISDQSQQYREELPDGQSCVFCGATDKGLHIDHVKPFSLLVNEYLEKREGGPLEYIKNPTTKTYEFADPIEKDKWSEYHKNNATFQPLCPPCNLKKGAKVL